MDEKKEIQKSIFEQKPEETTEEEFYNTLKLIAPGTNLRSALDGALKAGKGALLVVENPGLFPIMDGGFRVSCRFTPQRIVELCKMDGAIILSKDLKKINYSNVILAPNNTIKTNETGSRHKAAERTAKQINGLVIAISERRKEITLFYKNKKHLVLETSTLLRKVNEHIQLLEKQRDFFDRHLESLNRLELTNYPGLKTALEIIRKGLSIQRISEDLKGHIIELGNEGTLFKTRLKEVLSGVEKETNLVIKDYSKIPLKKSIAYFESLSYDDLLSPKNILQGLDYESQVKTEPIKGWRLLSKTSLTEPEIASLIERTKSLGQVLYAPTKSYENLIEVEKIRTFKEEIERMKINF